MGKGTDKLYITHSEWSSSDAFSASTGSGVRSDASGHASFKRLPFSYCALSLQPFNEPVCTADGTIFDHENIIRWLMKHNTNPTTGKPLKQSDLVKLAFAKNDSGEYVDPVTYKVFTDNTHIVAIRHGDSANAFAFDTVDRLNIKAKTWRDLVTDEEFTRKDMIMLQDPQNLESRNLSSFKYLKDGEDSGIPKGDASINTSAIGDAASLRVIKAKEAVAKARADRVNLQNAGSKIAPTQSIANPPSTKSSHVTPYNATRHTTGQAAASLTSTGITPYTSAALALMSDEDYLLKPKQVKEKGYVRVSTTLGDLELELIPEFAPKAVWNFTKLAQKGYYNGTKFHRNIRNFMIQGGDPTGTGKGGTSVWGKNFEDEFTGPAKHDVRGVVSMANKGKDTNSSQFFITYRPAAHLDRKHTIFGSVVEGMDTLKKMEDDPVDSNNRPKQDIEILEVVVYVDPFEEFQKKRDAAEKSEKVKEEQRQAGLVEDDTTTWTGKRIRRSENGGVVESTGIGRYLHANRMQGADDLEQKGRNEDQVDDYEPPKKKSRPGGFGNFDGW